MYCFFVPQTVWPHCGVLLVRVRGWFRSRFVSAGGFWPEYFPCAGPPKTRARRSKCLASRCSIVVIFGHPVVNPQDMDTKRVSGGQMRFACAGPPKNCVSAGQNLRFACAKPRGGSWSECFPCARPEKTRLRRSKFAFRLRETTGRILVGVFSLRTARKKRVSGSQNLRFVCAKPRGGSWSEFFPRAGPQKTRFGRSKFAFRLRATVVGFVAECSTPVSSKSAPQERQLSSKSVPHECQIRISYKSVKSGYHVRVSYHSVK